MTPPVERPPLSIQNGQLRFHRIGLQAAPWRDAYHAILRASWLGFFGALIAAYAVTNLCFAILFWFGGDCIGAQDPDSFLESFSFSVQTLSTIGYGGLSPTTLYAHVLMWIESFIGLVGVALATGMCFAKFSRPDARVAFSATAVVTRRNGRACLEFRMANERSSRIVDARLKLFLLYDDLSEEGVSMRRFAPLVLERDQSPMFLLTWTAMHFMDGDSPLADVTPETLETRMVTIIATVSGVDDTFMQTIHAQHYYEPRHILFDHRHVDIISNDDGVIVVDHSKLSDTMPDPAAPVRDALPKGATP